MSSPLARILNAAVSLVILIVSAPPILPTILALITGAVIMTVLVDWAEGTI